MPGEYYPCPTLDELLEELPSSVYIEKNFNNYYLEITKSSQTEKTKITDYDGKFIRELDYGTYTFCYTLKTGDDDWETPFIVYNTNPAEAAALLFIELKKAKLC
jgi:hypothetical protein